MGDEEVVGKSRFEPPPWEKEAFEALAAKRADEEAARAAIVAAESAVAAPVQEPDPWDEVPVVVASADGAAVAGTPGPTGTSGGPKPDEKAVEAMLMRLQNEERADARAAKMVGWVASAVTVVLGLGMLIAGIVMAARGIGTPVAAIGSLVLVVFGLAFIGMAIWMWVSTNRSRGR
jgi:hypothetical protein